MRPIRLLLLTSLVVTSCSKHPVQPAPNPFIFLGGAVGNQAAYWKFQLPLDNALGTPLPGGTLVTSVALSDTDVYFAGSPGLYWKDGSAVTVPGVSSISGIAVSGSDVYFCGIDNLANAAYWADGQETNLMSTLPNISFSLTVGQIAVSGGSIFVGASVSFSYGPDTSYYGNSPVYWDNGSLVYLASHGYGGIYYPSFSGIALSGSDVYVSGNIDIDADTMAWCGYWKNGGKVTLFNRLGDVYAVTSGIALSGEDVYVAGSYIDNGVSSAVYWKDGSMEMLPGGLAASAIAVNGSDVYVLGTNTAGSAVVWKDGAVAATLSSGAVATCMAVGN